MFTLITRFSISLLIILLYGPFQGLSQHIKDPTSEQITDFFDQVYGVDQRLVSGYFYYGPRKGSINGHAYFMDDTWKKGSISTDNRVYKNVDLKYDIESNQVILKYQSLNHSEQQIAIQKEHIDTFWMNDRTFVPFPDYRPDSSIIFCELLVSGEIDFLVLKRKILQLTNGGTNDFEYQEYVNQYLRIEDQLIQFKGERMIYRLFPQVKRELRKFKKSEGLILWRSKIHDRKIMIEHCNMLLLRNK